MEILDHFSKLFELNIRSTMGLLFWGNFALATLVFTFRFTISNKDSNTHLLLYGFSKIFQSFAWLAFFLRLDTVEFSLINIIVSNTLIFISCYIESIAMLMVVKYRSKRSFQVESILFAIVLLIFYGAVFFEAKANIRVLLSSFSIFILLIIPTLRFITEISGSLFKKIIGFNYILLLAGLLFRTIYSFFETSTSLYSVEPVQQIMFLFLFLIMIVSGVGYLLLLQEEKEMQIKKLLDDKDKFFSIIAHDLRGPFSGIIGLSELMLDDDNQLNPKETNEFIQLIHQSSKNASSLLENLLTWAQSQTGSLDFSPKKVETSIVVNKTINLLANIAISKNITIRSEIGNEEYVFCDKDMLETIFRNLISNAIKFTEINGEVQLSMIRENSRIVFSVKDSGIGIAPEKVKTLFAINHKNTTLGTNEEMGTGLGLMLCKDFVEKHNGTIWVESEVAKGSVFKFSIATDL